MIDTDKYEGHSEGEWKVGARKGAMTVRDSNGEEIAATNSYSNARIMADSPLLLEEVKRLREVISRAISTLLDNPPEELLEFTSPTPAQDIGDLIGFYEQAMGYAIGILEGTE